MLHFILLAKFSSVLVVSQYTSVLKLNVYAHFERSLRANRYTYTTWELLHMYDICISKMCRCGLGLMVVCATSVYHYLSCEFDPAHCEVYSIHDYAIKVVSDLRYIGVFSDYSFFLHQ